MPFWCIRYINYARYLLEDKPEEMVNKAHQRNNNLLFVQMFSPGNHSEMKLFGILAIEAMKNTGRREEWYVS